MDALREWLREPREPSILVTSLDACLQRIPPPSAISATIFKVGVGEVFDRDAFEDFALRTGYIADGLVDEPGEYAYRDDVVEIFPAGADSPMRIMISDDGTVSELRSYDAASQRTTETVDEIVFGPASELVTGHVACEGFDNADPMFRRMLQNYPAMQTVFEIVGNAKMCFAEGIGPRAMDYIEIIREARDFSGAQRHKPEERSLYLNAAELKAAMDEADRLDIDYGSAPEPPWLVSDRPRPDAVVDFAEAHHAAGKSLVIAGTGRYAETLRRRIERRLRTTFQTVDSWHDISRSKDRSPLFLDCALERGFLAEPDGVAVVSVAELQGATQAATNPATLLAEPELKPGDVVVHEDHGVGLLKALETIEVDNIQRDAARLEYRDGASVLVPLEEFDKLWRYGSEPGAVSLDRLHTDAWQKKRSKIQNEIRTVARHLFQRVRDRARSEAKTYAPPTGAFRGFSALFPYSETPDQQAAIDAVLRDLASGKPMNRLVCGDVGFGKTEVALRSAAAVALCGAQVALVCPTTVLARQHYMTFARRFAATGVEVAMLSRAASAKELKQAREGLASGKIGIVVATHAILAKDVRFADLGLLIVDEEHRFGKHDKEKMAGLSIALHRLSMSATPIPQTLQAAMVGVHDVSILATAPFRRRPVRTSLREFDKASMRIGLAREHRRGGQSFVVVPRIEDIEPLAALLSELVPELAVRTAHGKLPISEIDDVMVRYANGDGDVLLATNIIESGLDIPNANTIFVWRADRFGLAQLHQLRGRVGRGKAQGVAYLLLSPDDAVSDDTRARLSAMVEHDRLGDGLALSLQDLELRGGGDLVGEDQAGHLKVLGTSLYRKLLERSIDAVMTKSEKEGALPNINVGLTGNIPSDYIPDAAIRLNINARLLRVRKLPEIDAFSEELEDRFGELPDEVTILLQLAKLKIMAAQFGITRLDSGPKAVAFEFERKPSAKTISMLFQREKPVEKNGRLILDRAEAEPAERVAFLEDILQGGS